MIYIYDILLNFNRNLVEFFYWNDNDDIKYIKKVPLFKVSKKLINDLIYKSVQFEKDFLEHIKNQCIFYENEEVPYITLLSDGDIVIGIILNNKKVELVSRLLLDEEQEILNVCSHINETIINYKVLNTKDLINRNNSITKEMKIVKDKLLDEFLYLYNANKIEKLNYYYYEYFNKVCNDKNKTYNDLVNSLENITEKHFLIYEIVVMSYQKKSK